jgi:(2Fe-2S) ferredoxin
MNIEVKVITTLYWNSANMLSDKASPLTESEQSKTLQSRVESLGLKAIQRHIFLCTDQTHPLCCDKAIALEAWDYLKKRLKALNLDRVTPDQPTCVFRTKANCLRVCQRGPIMVIYPDGIWYHSATPPVIEKIIQEHLLQNQVVLEYAFLEHHLELPKQKNA